MEFLSTLVSWAETIFTNKNIFVDKKKISPHANLVARNMYMHVSNTFFEQNLIVAHE